VVRKYAKSRRLRQLVFFRFLNMTQKYINPLAVFDILSIVLR